VASLQLLARAPCMSKVLVAPRVCSSGSAAFVAAASSPTARMAPASILEVFERVIFIHRCEKVTTGPLPQSLLWIVVPSFTVIVLMSAPPHSSRPAIWLRCDRHRASRDLKLDLGGHSSFIGRAGVGWAY